MADHITVREYLLHIVRAVLNGEEAPPMPSDIEPQKLVGLAYRNSLQVILYRAFTEAKTVFPPALWEKLEKSYKAAVLREAAQQAELCFIRKAFAENKIDFMLLKGAHLKALYPEPEMRFMVDMDILVRLEDVEKAEKLICSRGFTREMNNGKDLVLIKKPFLNIELHNALFTEEDEMAAFFQNVWDTAEPVTAHEYKMNDSDLYVYVTAHLAEHFKLAGSCFRPVMDLFLLRKFRTPMLDISYIDRRFAELKLSAFSDSMIKVGAHFFGGKPPEPELALTEKYILLGAPVENADVVSRHIGEKKSKASILLSYAFPKFSHMKKLYPFLSGLPFLLPLCWLARLLKKGGRAKKKAKALQFVNTENSKKMEEIFKNAGL